METRERGEIKCTPQKMKGVKIEPTCFRWIMTQNELKSFQKVKMSDESKNSSKLVLDTMFRRG